MIISLISFVVLMIVLGVVEAIMMNGVTSNRMVFNSQSGAVIKLGALISDIRGKLQNGVYSLAKGGVHYVKNIPASVTNPNSADQQVIRHILQSASKCWYIVLTPLQRTGWDELAQTLGGLAYEGNGGILNLVPPIGMKGSGFNAFVAFWARAYAAGVAEIALTPDAPLAEQQPTPPSGLIVGYAGGTLSVTWTDPVISDVSAVIAVWIRSHQKTYHRQIVSYAALASSPLLITQARGALGGYIPFADVLGDEIIVQLQTVNPSGWASPGGETQEIVLA